MFLRAFHRDDETVYSVSSKEKHIGIRIVSARKGPQGYKDCQNNVVSEAVLDSYRILAYINIIVECCCRWKRYGRDMEGKVLASFVSFSGICLFT